MICSGLYVEVTGGSYAVCIYKDRGVVASF